MPESPPPTPPAVLPQAAEWSVEFDGTSLVFGLGALARLGELATGLGCRKVLLVSDRGVRAAGHVERAERALDAVSVEAVTFDGVESNPTTRHVEAGARIGSSENVDGIVGLGGGSPMDCAKGINFVLTNGGRMEDYRGFARAGKPMLPSIGIPCTAGTGSDAQSYALISSAETGEKMACGDRKAKFRAVILDPALCTTATREVTAISGLDAASHALESYVCTRRNPVAQALAREAWRLIETELHRVLVEPGDETARGRMLVGAHLAGAAIEHSMLGAAHACANPLTARHDVVHGVAVALMLPHVMRFNSGTVDDLYRELHAPTRSAARGESARERFEALRLETGLPAALGDCGVPRKSLAGMAREAAAQWTASFNPRPLTERELLELYEAAY